MTKEEFLKRRDEIREQFSNLYNEYIETNIVYPVGTKVEVTNPNGKRYCKVRVGIVKDNIVHEDDVRPLVYQIANDGTETKRRIIVDATSEVKIL